MRNTRTLLMTLILLTLTGCAGISLLSGAGHQFEQGLALFNRGQYEQAIPYFQSAIEKDPDYGKAYLYLGRSRISLGQWAEAISPLRTAFRLSPAETQKEVLSLLFDALFGAALSDFKAGNYQRSISYLREGLTVNPESEKAQQELVGSLLAYGGQLLSQGQFQEALSTFSEALQLSPGNVDAYLGLAQSYFNSGEIQNAVEALKNATAVDPTNSRAQSLFWEILK